MGHFMFAQHLPIGYRMGTRGLSELFSSCNVRISTKFYWIFSGLLPNRARIRHSTWNYTHLSQQHAHAVPAGLIAQLGIFDVQPTALREFKAYQFPKTPDGTQP